MLQPVEADRVVLGLLRWMEDVKRAEVEAIAHPPTRIAATVLDGAFADKKRSGRGYRDGLRLHRALDDLRQGEKGGERGEGYCDS